MKTISVTSWPEVREALSAVDRERERLMKEHGFHRSSELLFRGHGDASWSLRTTLERTVTKKLSLPEYYRHILKARPQIEAFSDHRWDLPGLEEYTKWADSQHDLEIGEFHGYEYMVYLRHHGFPSPLLDWSASPYVAAYFAYRSIPSAAKNVAIHCYLDTLGISKSWSGGDPLIAVKGPYVRSHRRHFLQQCKYTVCARLHEGALSYESHEIVFALNEPTQHLLWKIEAPVDTVAHALRDLDSMNVNALSLMGSEDALVETLASREYKHGV